MGNGESYPPDIDMLRARAVMGLGALYIRGGDALQFTVYNSVSSLVVQFRGFLLNADQRIVPFSVQINPTSDRAATSVTETIGEGVLLHLTAFITTGNANRGQAYCRVRILQGNPSTPMPTATILQGYVTDDYSPSFPGGKMEGPLEGPGYVYTTGTTDPAAGTGKTAQVPDGATWRLLSIHALFDSDSNAGNRSIYAVSDDGTNTLWLSISPTVITADQLREVAWGVGFDRNINTTYGGEMLPLPATRIPAGGSVAVAVDTIKATDQLSQMAFVVEEWIQA